MHCNAFLWESRKTKIIHSSCEVAMHSYGKPLFARWKFCKTVLLVEQITFVLWGTTVLFLGWTSVALYQLIFWGWSATPLCQVIWGGSLIMVGSREEDRTLPTDPVELQYPLVYTFPGIIRKMQFYASWKGGLHNADIIHKKGFAMVFCLISLQLGFGWYKQCVTLLFRLASSAPTLHSTVTVNTPVGGALDTLTYVTLQIYKLRSNIPKMSKKRKVNADGRQFNDRWENE